MPRNVRNFWITADVDGRSSSLEGGPVAKDGGIDVRIKQRSDGEVTDALSILGRARPDGSLVLRVFDGAGNELGCVDTRR